jgi:hypothetical protein
VPSLNLGLRLLLELGALGAVAAWGFFAAPRPLLSWLYAVTGAGLVALVWGLFVAPKAPSRLEDPWRVLVEVGVFGGATLALAATGRLRFALIYGALSAASLAAMFLFRQRGL